MVLDVGTLAFSTATITLSMAASMLFAARKERPAWVRLYFPGAEALYGIGLLLIVSWPKAGWSLILGNTLVFWSLCSAHAGICHYARRQPAWLAYGLLTAVLLSAFATSFLADAGGVNARIVATSAVRIPFHVHAIVLLTRSDAAKRLASSRAFRAIFCLFLLLLVVRVADVVFVRQSLHSFVEAAGYQALYYLGTALSFVGLAISFTMMCGEREAARLHETIAARTAELRLAKERAEDALAAKSRFLAAAGHDLRQVTHAMTLLLAAIDHELARSQPEKADLGGLTGEMAQLTNSMTEQLNALLEIARLDSGTLDPRTEKFPLSTAFAKLNAQFSRMAAAGDVDLRFVRSSLVLDTDPALFLSVLGNLLHNAIKFGKGGRVLVGCRRCKDGLSIQIWDEGPGIPAEHFDTIFQEFRQIDNPNRDRSKGLGLGLSIAQRTAALLGMRVRVRSVPGTPTMFAVEAGSNVL